MPNYSDLISGYSRLMPNYSDLTSGYSRPILIPHSAKRVLDCRHYGCRQNKLRLLWNALLTTPYVSEHYKHMFLVSRDLYEMLVLSRGKHTSRRSTVGIWSEVRVYRTPATNISWAGVLRLGKFPDKRRLINKALPTQATAWKSSRRPRASQQTRIYRGPAVFVS